MFYSAAFISLLIEGINWYHQHYSDTLNKWPFPVCDNTESEMLLFLVIIIPLQQDIQGCLKDYWTGLNSFWHHFTASKIMIHDRVQHIIGYLHFSISDNAIDNKDPNYKLRWKIRCIFEMVNDIFSNYYTPTAHLTVEGVTVLFTATCKNSTYPTSTNILEKRFINYVT